MQNNAGTCQEKRHVIDTSCSAYVLTADKEKPGCVSGATGLNSNALYLPEAYAIADSIASAFPILATRWGHWYERDDPHRTDDPSSVAFGLHAKAGSFGSGGSLRYGFTGLRTRGSVASDRDDARPYFSAGNPIVTFGAIMGEASAWANWASRKELKAYALACFNRMSPADRRAFLAYVQGGAQ